MRKVTVLARVGAILAAVGLTLALVGALWNSLLSTVDANIGAGILIVVGLPLTIAGVVLFVISAIVGAVDRRPARTRRTR